LTPPLPPAGRWPLAYAGRIGWRVLPVGADKRPLVRDWPEVATTDPETIASWWRRWPDAGVGVMPPAGWAVLDFDSPQALELVRAEGFDLPSTAVASTPRGAHHYYRTAAPLPSRCGLLPGLDLIAGGDRRYLVAPPGEGRRWLRPPREAAELPAWVVELAGAGTAGGSGPRPPLREVLAHRVREGERNVAMTRLAGLAFRLLPAAEAVMLCTVMNEKYFDPPLAEDELERILASVAKRELERRHGR